MTPSPITPVAIISGALGDIGSAIAMELAGRGATIALGDLAESDRAQPLLAKLTDTGVRARYDRVDVADAAAVGQWIQNVAADLGTPTLIIPNAAIVTFANSQSITPEQWDRELRVNLNGAFHMAQAASKLLVAQQLPGRIVFIGSWAAARPHPHIVAYSAAKAALRMLCRCMAIDLAPHDIQVNEVAPGYVDAGLSGRIFTADPDVRRRAVEQVPLKRLITAEEVAQQVAWLCDPANRQMTGSVLLMDGGLSQLSGSPQVDP
jgi:NAD(P)-dependent dehydrogenase (short-subunit alcohol dehydrogenase family)